MSLVLSLVAAYLLGSVPFAAVAARLKGVDLRAHGSGNLGATNAIRVLGPAVGVPVLLADLAKGLVAVSVVPGLLGLTDPGGRLAAGVCAILGHVFPVFLRFRGGKGVATAGGVFLGLAPTATGVVLAVFLVVLVAGRWVSLASVAAAVALPVTLLGLGGPRSLVGAGAAVAVLVVVRHRTNLVRIVAGTESRIPLGRRPGGGDRGGAGEGGSA